MDNHYVGAYWLARHESAETCARRAESFFTHLGRCEPTWGRWHETARSFAKARQRHIGTDAASFEKFFASKRHRIGDGFYFWLWAGETPDETTGINSYCGSSSPHPPSCCVFNPPSEGLVAERVHTATVMSEVLRAMALAWEPEWGVATSEAYRDMVSERAVPGTFVGWVMYFSRQRGTVPPLPAPVRVEPVEDKGTLVLLTPERFSATNPEHVALAARVHGLLEAAGLLGPLRPHGSS